MGAQDSSKAPFSVRAAMALARENHPALVAAGGRHQAESGRAWQEAALPNPLLEWRREGIGGPVEADRFLTVSQSLGLTGRHLALRSAARQVDTRAVADSITVVRHVEAAAAAAYWRASLARALLEVSVTQREDAEELARVESHRAREGAVAELVDSGHRWSSNVRGSRRPLLAPSSPGAGCQPGHRYQNGPSFCVRTAR